MDKQLKDSLPEGYAPALEGLSEAEIEKLREQGFKYVSGNGERGLEPIGEDEARQLVQETQPDDGDPSSPYFLGPIILDLVPPSKILEQLRERLNKGYMPSATGHVSYNSKPEYVRHVNSWVKSLSSNNYGTGCYQEVDELGYTHKDDPIWAFIETTNLELACNLQTDELYARINRNGPYPWVPYDKPLPVNLYEFSERIESHL